MASDTFKIISESDNRNKIRKTVAIGWSNKLNDIIWQKRRLKCAISFKRATPRNADILFTGSCKECGATIEAIFDLTTERLSVDITKYNQNVIHKKKRRITNYERQDIARLLDGKTAYAVQSKLADDLMNENDVEPAHLPNINTLRKIKFDQNRPQHSNPALSLQIMKKTNHKDNIQFMSLDPFAVFYCSVLQNKWYTAEFKRRGATISIDATGLGLRKTGTSDDKYMFLYVICARG